MIDIREHGGSFGGGGLKASDKQALIDIVNTAETNQTTIKTNIATVLNSKIGSSLTNASSWLDVQNAIDNMTNKKCKSGTGTASSTTLTVSGLPFTPKLVFVKYTGNKSFTLYTNYFNSLGNTNVVLDGTYGISSSNANGSLYSGGFSVQTGTNGTHDWIAFE